MSTTCKYCNESEDKQTRPGLVCVSCISFVHLKCLRRQNTPGNFSCDVFFEFTCEDCSPDNTEILTRYRFQWVNVLLLTLNHLQNNMQGISNKGYFHWKSHVCSFIDRYWLQLFGAQCKRKKNWMGTIAGALSVYNNLFFCSGSQRLGETGWWKLIHSFSPAVAAHIVQELARDKPKGRLRDQMALDKTLFVMKVTEMGYKEYFNDDNDVPPEPVPCKKRRVDSDESSAVSGSSAQDHYDADIKTEEPEDIFDSTYSGSASYSEMENIFHGFTTSHLPPSDSSSLQSYKQTQYDSDSRSSHNPTEYHSDEERSRDTKKIEPKKKAEETVVFKRESLFSTQLNSVDLPWVEKQPDVDNRLVELTEYEELQLLKNVENMLTKVREPNRKASLQRLRAKLALRRLKRHKRLPIFDIDKIVKLLGGFAADEQRLPTVAERILDRFQRSYLIDNLCGTVASTVSGPLLVSDAEPTPIRSPHSGAILKPYIRRDATSKPLWLKLTDELLRRTHRQEAGYEPPPHATIDYSYVRPNHIAAVNSLCAQFFWPGIDLTEALQYPEFSCVVTYKRLVVGCAFLVPDVRHNEAYISFVLTRPEWRNAKIASFMLYHLLQTCTGMDVTLHVSPTNPAIFLYQKFGFKVEELIQDFYEKYYDMDYKGCRHALFLRLTR